MHPVVTAFRHEPSGTFSYVVHDADSSATAVIDPAADFEYRAGRITHQSADEILAFIRSEGLEVQWILETHAHADHLSGAPYLREKAGTSYIKIPLNLFPGTVDKQPLKEGPDR